MDKYHVDGPRTNNHLEGFHHALKRKTSSAPESVRSYKNIDRKFERYLNSYKFIMDRLFGEQIGLMKD
ncbi:unnamed protein product [Gordionus sp. m RMFG-2023]